MTLGHPQNLLVRYPPGVHPKGRPESVAVWEEGDLGTVPVSSNASLVHVSLVDVGPYPRATPSLAHGERDHQNLRIILSLPTKQKKTSVSFGFRHSPTCPDTTPVAPSVGSYGTAILEPYREAHGLLTAYERKTLNRGGKRGKITVFSQQ